MENLQEYRKEAENRLRSALLSNITVYQFALSAHACGCVSLGIFPRRLYVEDVESIEEEFLRFFKKISYDFGVSPKNISYQRGENFEILQLKSISLCKRCNFEYGTKRTWPDVYVMEASEVNEGIADDANRLLLYRGEIEERLRDLTKRIIYVTELAAFALNCSCRGLTASVRGLKKEYIEVGAFSFLNEVARSLLVDMEPKAKARVIYGRIGYGSSEILRLTSRRLCERCKVFEKNLYVLT